MRRAALLAAAGILWLASSAVEADIYRWSDEQGVVHFTTSLEGVPDEARARVQPFVRERPRAPLAPAAVDVRAPREPAPIALAPASAPADPGAIEDRLARAFAAGVEAGSIERGSPIVEVHPAPVVQNVVVEAPDASPGWIVGGFVPVPPHSRRRPAPPPRAEPARPASRHGPAGPPPIGAAGPPPLGTLR